jgi:Zinc finger, C3HC4 type (RING finger)
MERLQPFTSTAVASEHLPDPLPREDPASSRASTQNDMNSPPSTIPLDEASVSNSVLARQFPSDDNVRAETRFRPIMIDDSEDDRLAQSSPRPRLAKARRPDYAGQAFLDAIDGAGTGSSHRRKRKREHASTDADPAEVTAILVSISHLNFRFRLTVLQDESYDKIRHYCHLLDNKVKKLENRLLASNQENEVLKRQNEQLTEQNDQLKKCKALICSICMDPKEEWKILGCGHMLCLGCVHDLKDCNLFWDCPCPMCRKPIQLCADCYPDLQS